MAKALWICYFGTALICQWLFYHFPKTFFAFPVNVGLLLFLTVGLWVISREKRFSPFASRLSSLSTTYLLLTLFLGSCLVQGFTCLPRYRHMVVRSRPDCLGCTPHIGTVSRSVPSTPLQTAFHTRACGSFACFVRRFLRSSRHLRMAGDSD